MTNDLRVVVDTNVVVSAALIADSTPREAIEAAAKHGRLLVSKETIGELETVLSRSKFDRYTSLASRLEFLAILVEEAEAIEVTEVIKERRDPKDDKLLELAVSGNATHIVTGDVDLLCLHPFRGIDILSPQAFLSSLSKSSA